MKEIFNILKQNPLFKGINYEDFPKIYESLNAKVKSYKKSEHIIFTGDEVNFIGIVIEGSAKIIKEDINGNSSVISKIEVADMFGEVFAFGSIKKFPVSVEASDYCRIFLFDYKKLINKEELSYASHFELIKNMLSVIAEKNLMFNKKIEILSKRSIREKIITYLSMVSNGQSKFIIPYNREQLADYLCVDRSALSKELCKMRDENIIIFNKNSFQIL